MKVLGIETALGETEVALLNEGKGQRPATLIDHNLYSESVVTLAQSLLDASGITLKELDGIAVSSGPGSFTGLRIGLSVAKGFALAAGLPLVSVPTLDALSASAVLSGQIEESSNFLVLIDAKRNDYYCATYRNEHGNVMQITEPRVVNGSEILPQLSQGLGIIVVGSDKSKLELQLMATLGPAQLRLQIFEKGNVISPAGAVALLGLQKLVRGEVSDLVSLEPSYLKDFIVQIHH